MVSIFSSSPSSSSSSSSSSCNTLPSLPISLQLSDCISKLVAQGVDPRHPLLAPQSGSDVKLPTESKLPVDDVNDVKLDSISSFWSLYAISPTLKLQRNLMEVIESRLADELLSSLQHLHEKARIIACRVKRSADWLLVFPSSSHFRLLDSHFQLAVRLRLGLPPQEGLPLCCKCDESLDSDPNHFLTCKLLRRTITTTRHDLLVKLLCSFTRLAGAVPFLEPKGLDGTGSRRPDIQVHFPDGSCLVDASITHPAAKTYAPMGSTTPLSAAIYRERFKHRKYDIIAADEKSPFYLSLWNLRRIWAGGFSVSESAF